MKLYRLGNSAVRNRDIRTAALPTMIDLRDRSGSTVILAIRSDDFEMLCLERLDGHVIINNELLPGTTAPLHVGAVGKILLAAEPEFWDEYAERSRLPRYTPSRSSPATGSRDARRGARVSGIAISDEDRLLGMAGVGAPIHDHDHDIVGAVSSAARSRLCWATTSTRASSSSARARRRSPRALGYDAASPPR